MACARWSQSRLCDERGAMMVLGAMSIVVAIAATALAVDLGRLAYDRRDLQGVADAAALDGVQALGPRDIPATQLAGASATRNGFDGDVGVVVGQIQPDRTVLETSTDPDAVEVTVTREIGYLFTSGSGTNTVSAVATTREIAGIAAGTWLANVDSNEAALLNALLSELGTGVNLDLVHYEALAGATVEIGPLFHALELDAGAPDQVADADVGVAQLAQAMLELLDDDGGLLAVALNEISTSVAGSAVVRFGDVLALDVAEPGAAADVAVNALSLLSVASQVANGGNLVDLGAGVSVPGVADADVAALIIEPPQIVIGGVGSTVRTAQARLYFDLEVGSLLGGVVNLPVMVEAASGEATISDISCAPGTDETTVQAVTEGARATIANIPASQRTAANPTLGDATLLHVPLLVRVTTKVDESVSGTSEEVPFTGPHDWNNTASVSGTSLGLGGLLTGADLDVHVLGLNIGLGSLVSDLMSLLSPVLNALDGVVSSLFDALGVSLAGVDLTSFHHECGGRTLVR